MTYTPLYTSEVLVEGLTQIDITVSTKPTTAQVLDFIQEIEAQIIEKCLGSHTATDEYIDVPTQSELTGAFSVTWTPSVDSLRFTYESEGVLVPLYNVKKPFITITSLAKNDESYDDAPVWDTLTEGPALNSSFMLLKSGSKALGYALYFYDNYPLAGPKRLKMTYTYGYNVNSAILQDYCTYGACIRVLMARMGTSQADGLTELQTSNIGIYVPTQYQRRIDEFKAQMKEIEIKYFPKPNIPFAML